MKLRWLGHSSFLIETGQTAIVTDPFDDTPGYGNLDITADLVIVSHDHHDHNAIDKVSGNPRIISTVGYFRFNEIEIKGVSTFHDNQRGRIRGNNIAFVIRAEGLTICHLGDLGHMLDLEQLEAIGQVDVLLVPIGGRYTISAQDAVQVVKLINPQVAIPMHYKTPVCPYPISPLQDFAQNYDVIVKMPFLELSASQEVLLPEIVVLDYSYI